ncbi:MAG: TRC40/GET3/ArsA family transport-energizing ATPase [Candidatus Lokiarchaeota archaeon]|nr:TRC40/GET3/ArsA family transport-energizing ATPase [Candidatus Harpocratesius repetitus]
MENILVFGGKGGVGKSSISTATAVHLARKLPQKKILLVSFDIAHNLSDLFEKEIGNDITQITPNLFVIEPDPDLYALSYTGELTKKTRELFKSSKLMAMIPQLESIVEESLRSENLPLAMKNALFFQSIIDAENPMQGIGERKLRYIALNQSKETPLNERALLPKFDIMVCDFPPTGNMIALFEVPADPSRRLMKLTLKIISVLQDSLNKFKSITKWAQPAIWMAKHAINKEAKPSNPLDKEDQQNLAQNILDLLYEMEKRSDRIAALLKGIGSLRLVSIPEKPSFEEAKRAKILSEPFISVDVLHINRLIPPSEMGKTLYLDKILSSQEKYRQKIHKEFQDLKIWESHWLEDEPIGIDGLTRLAEEIYKDSSTFEILNPLNRYLKNPTTKQEKNPLNIEELRQKWRES